MTAIAGAIGLQLTKRHNAIPLGTRTFFTALERSFYDDPTILNDDANSIPALTTLRIELVQAGKIIVALHTVHQDGISRLGGPGFSKISPVDVQPNIDVWLAPNGTVARVISADTTLSTAFAPKQAKNDASARQITEAKQRVWKATVLEWISNVGLSVDSSEDEHWVEVEVSEPFYARLAAEHLRKMDDGQSSSPLKRILWPAQYCFRRTKVSSSSHSEKPFGTTTSNEDPLYFAENWLETATSRHEKATGRSLGGQEASQKKAPSLSKSEIPEKIESLARAVHYPDLQSASSVYPTPPDGALVPGINPVNSDNLGVDGQDMGLSHTSGSVKQQEHASEDSGGKAALQAISEMEVGSGLYDTNDDDELFSGINDRDFGTKGITDADFSFFDDDEMDDFLADNPEIEHPQDMQQPSLGEAAGTQIPQEEVKADQVAPKDEIEEQLMETHSPNNMEVEPELKVETQQPHTEPHNRTSKDSSSGLLEKVMSAPLSPIDIKKMLFSRKDAKQTSRPSNPEPERKQSRYNAISFKQGMTLSDQKYANAGRFFFMANKDNADSTNSAPGIPTIGFPRGRKSGPRTFSEEGIAESRQAGSGQSVQRSDSMSSDETSFDSSDDYSEIETSPVRATTLKRKRPLSEAEKSTTSSMERLSIASEAESHASKEDTSIFLGNFFSSFTDWSLVGYFSAKQSPISAISSRKEDQMQVAQLVVDQLTQSSLSHSIDGWESVLDLENEIVNLHTCLEDGTVIGETEKLDLKTYISLHDVQQTVVETPSTRPNPQRREIKGSITKLPPAHLRIHRGRDFLEVLPTSMPFWETFGLAPASGQKDVSAYCIYPHFLGDGADSFMTRLEFLYSSCNLGKHARGDKSKIFENGIGLWNIAKGDASYARTMQALRSLCEGLGMKFSKWNVFCGSNWFLGNALSKAPPIKENFVIYIINPFTHGAAFTDICSTFFQLFHKYIGDVDKAYAKSQLNELVLQIVPLSFIFSPTSLVVPTQSQYVNLALEVYSRCPPKDANSGIIGYAPPVVLANAVPKVINFRVTSERFSPFQEGRCLHVAVSRSVDQRWISAAWSDNSGSCQITMSYCVRARGSNVNRIVSEIRQEIWEATKDLMERTQTRWKVLLVRTEPIDQEEIDGKFASLILG
jgi:mediator of RNA polymerase II transcription subunit 13, fungi type